MVLGQAQQLARELTDGPLPQLLDSLRAMGRRLRGPFQGLSALTLDPRAVLLGKQLRMAAGPPSRKCDADSSVRPDANHISSGFGMTDEIHERITIVLRHGS